MPRKKSPVTPPGIDSGTFRLAAQCLNHYATPGPLTHTVELHQSGLNETASHPVMQKIRINGFLQRLHWQFEMGGKKILQTAVLGYIFIYVQIKH
jgi:hypothetical protein